MGKPKMTRPKWVDITEIADGVKTAEGFLLERKAIFERMLTSDTISDKDRSTATDVVAQIDDICTDNKLVLKHIRSVVAKKTHLKPRAGIKESDQNEYLELITKIDTRLSATGAFDEMLMQKLGIAMRKKEEV